MLLNHVPEFCRVLVLLRDFIIKTNNIDVVSETKTNSKSILRTRLGDDIPEWLAVCCQQVVMNHFREEQSEQIYDNHFSTLDFDLSLPYDVDCCWGVLLPESIHQVYDSRSKEIADWLHGQCTVWYENTADANKTERKKQHWKLVTYEKTKLPLWCDEAFRKIGHKHVKFSTDIEYSDAKNQYGNITHDHLLLVFATFFNLFNDCHGECVEEIVARKTVVQHSVVISYVTHFTEFAMVTKALPFFIIENIDSRMNATTAQKAETREKALWFSKSIDAMKSVSDLASILPNLAPLIRNSSTSEENKLTMCKSISVAFERYQWQNFTGGNQHLS